MNENYLKQIDRLIRQRPRAASALRSYGELAHLMMPAEPGRQLKTEPFNFLGKSEFPLFTRDHLPLDLDAAAVLLNRFFIHLSEAKREDRSGLNRALKESRKDPAWKKRLFTAVLEQNEDVLSAMAEEAGLDPLTLLFLGKTALRPSLEALRRFTENIIDENRWGKGRCPLCGSQPDMARFTKAGRRRLHCGLCGREWDFARLGCPFCDNGDPKSLGYLEAEGEEGLRIYYCDLCHRYLKTIDARVFEEVAPLELENLATLHLDVIAAEYGYT